MAWRYPGDKGALAGKPVMEGKGLPFKIFADIDVFDIELDEDGGRQGPFQPCQKPVPSCVLKAYNADEIVYGRDFIPKQLDPRLISTVAPAVAKAAIESGVAKYPVKDWRAYKKSLSRRLSEHIKKVSKCNV